MKTEYKLDNKDGEWWVIAVHDDQELDPICRADTKAYAELIKMLLEEQNKND